MYDHKNDHPLREPFKLQDFDLSRFTDEELQEHLNFLLSPVEYDQDGAEEAAAYKGPSVDTLTAAFGKANVVFGTFGERQDPIVCLAHHTGAEAYVHLYGGHVCSWKDASGKEMLSTRHSLERHTDLIDGGVGLEFPKTGKGLPGQQANTIVEGGFFGRSYLTVVDTRSKPDSYDNEPSVTFQLEGTPAMHPEFPHSWKVTYTVGLTANDDPLPDNDEYIDALAERQGYGVYGRVVARIFDEAQELGIDLDKARTHFKALYHSGAFEDMLAKEFEEEEKEKPTKQEAAIRKFADRHGRFREKDPKVERQKDPNTEDVIAMLEEEYLEETGEAGTEDGHRKLGSKQPPTQLRFHVEIENTGDDAFEFQAATIASLATEDIRSEWGGAHVRMLGLWRQTALDVSNPAQPIVTDIPEEYLYPFAPEGSAMELIVPKMDIGDVLFCPGDNSHYKLCWREGYADVLVRHVDTAKDEISNCYATLGAGRAAVPVKLQPGKKWKAEFSLRKYYRLWPTPDFEIERERAGAKAPGVDEADMAGVTDSLNQTPVTDVPKEFMRYSPEWDPKPADKHDEDERNQQEAVAEILQDMINRHQYRGSDFAARKAAMYVTKRPDPPEDTAAWDGGDESGDWSDESSDDESVP